MLSPPPPGGLLFYLKAGMHGLPFLQHEKRGTYVICLYDVASYVFLMA